MGNMIINPYLTNPNHASSSSQRHPSSSPASSFSGAMKSRAAAQADANPAAGLAQSKKTELLNKFPALTEERLDQLAREYDIEAMDSDQLYHLAETLMDEGIIPSRPRENGLNLIAVFPKALYDASLNGETLITKGVVREAFTGCYAVNPAAGTLDYQSPKYGLKHLSYDVRMMQSIFNTCNSYYTEEERARQISLANSKTRFWEFASLLTDYRDYRKS